MKRKIIAALVAAAVATAVGVMGGATPAGADGEVRISAQLNRCSAYTSGGSGQCFFTAIPDTYNTLRLYAPYAYGSAKVTCDGLVVVASISGGPSPNSMYSIGWTNPGGACTLTVYGWSSTWADVY